MTKKRIRYSELAARIAPLAEAETASAQPELPSTLSAEPPTPRVSTPIDLARALAAAHREEELASIAAIVESEPYLRRRDRIRARTGVADLLMFRISGELFAVELLGVEEVIDVPVIHHVPEMPPAMLGVVNVRGSLTPVYTPHPVLGIPLAQRDAVLIFRTETSRVGILIDDVEDAVTLDLRDLRDAPSGSEVLLGVVRHVNVLVALVDADALIAACQVVDLVETA